ncbi:MAG: hypothetical protein OXU75_03290 [Deltaproteobacteria bacterium]|nr:hypothetical protein [Deltaproteobacteria bacterium]
MAGTVLLVVHIAAGAVALVAAAVALSTAKGRLHHIRAGRVYAAAMALVCVTALPLAILGDDVVLLLVAVFSFYLVFAGWRFARNAGGRPQPVDWSAAVIMALTGPGMWVYGAVLFPRGDSQWVTMAVFGFIAVALSAADLRYHRTSPRPGAQRIARHLTNMLAGTIATVTAVVVVNVDTRPAWLAWILPTLLITPLIAWWNRRVLRGRDSTPGIR